MQRLDYREIYYGKDPQDAAVFTNNIARSMSALDDLNHAHKYDHVLVNPYWEGHPKWNRRPDGTFTSKPEGDVLKVIEAFAEILLTGKTANSEHWPHNLVQKNAPTAQLVSQSLFLAPL